MKGSPPQDNDLSLYVLTTGVEVPRRNGWLTLANATTYFFEVPASSTGLLSVFESWDTALVAALTFESTNLPMEDASVFVAAGKLWFPETGPGTLSIAGGSAGCNMHHFADFCARRMRGKLVVTTGGAAQWRVRPHLKAVGG